jgi:hypothetical protein
MAFAGVTPVGALLIGSVAEALGVSTACAVGGGSALVAVLALLLVYRRRGLPVSATP